MNAGNRHRPVRIFSEGDNEGKTILREQRGRRRIWSIPIQSAAIRIFLGDKYEYSSWQKSYPCTSYIHSGYDF
jgi:hypothetical protein